MPEQFDRRPNQQTRRTARKAGPLGGRPRVGPVAGIAAGLTGGRAPLTPAQNQTLEIFRHAAGPGGLPGLAGGPAPLPGSAVAPETVQGLQGAVATAIPGLPQQPSPQQQAPATAVDRGLAALPGFQTRPADPNAPFAGINQTIEDADREFAAAQAGAARQPGLPPLPPTELEIQQRLTAASQANQLGDVERFEARQRAPVQRASTAFQGAFRAGDTSNPALFSPSNDLGAFTEQRRQLGQDVQAGLTGTALREADRAIGAFNPDQVPIEQARENQRARFAALDEGRRVGSPEVTGQELRPRQLARREAREQELARRELRRTNRGVGAPFNISDEEADVALQRQEIRRGLAGDPGREITETESLQLGFQPGSSPAGQRRVALGGEPLPPEQVRAIGLTGGGTTETRKQDVRDIKEKFFDDPKSQAQALRDIGEEEEARKVEKAATSPRRRGFFRGLLGGAASTLLEAE